MLNPTETAKQLEAKDAEIARLRAALRGLEAYAAGCVLGGWRHQVVGMCRAALHPSR